MQMPKARFNKRQTKKARHNMIKKWDLGGIIEPVSISGS